MLKIRQTESGTFYIIHGGQIIKRQFKTESAAILWQLAVEEDPKLIEYVGIEPRYRRLS